jgi:hypothetical protein
MADPKPMPMNVNITIGEKYGPAMEITEQADADAYFERCVQHTMSYGKTLDEAEAIERINLGYYSGYYNVETMARVNRLFQSVIVGKHDTAPVPSETPKSD